MYQESAERKGRKNNNKTNAWPQTARLWLKNKPPAKNEKKKKRHTMRNKIKNPTCYYNLPPQFCYGY